jgi:iron complex outermembrane recepter protein
LASGFYRYPNQSRTLTTIYPIGFSPEINSRIKDASISAGVRGEINGWDVDFSNTFGSNSFQFIISNTHNASRGTPSPTTFNSGGFKFKQNTTNLDLSRYFDDPMNGINVAFGAEFRVESYQLLAGEEGSYRNYGNVRTLNLNDSTLNESTTNIFYGRPGGAQVFPGFSPANELLESRNAAAAYADIEFNFTKNFFVDIAGRYENWSDFGDTWNGKVALRWAILENLAIRGAGSTGFRAPSLHQRYFNSTSTLFQTVNGVTTANEVGTFRNDSRVAKLLGVPSLKAEKATNVSVGLTFDVMDGFSVSIDGYLVNVNDRVTLTNSFGKGIDPEIDAALDAANASKAQLFANGIDTETKGVDIVANYATTIGQGSLNFILGANFTKTDVVRINVPGTLIGNPDAFFNRENRSQFETGTPQSKVNFGINYKVSKFHAGVNFVYFGKVIARTGAESDPSTWVDQTFAGKMITDLSLGYDLTKNLNLTVGANNLLNVYPDENIDAFRSSNRFVYSRRVSQFGANGGFYFARLNFNF